MKEACRRLLDLKRYCGKNKLQSGKAVLYMFSICFFIMFIFQLLDTFDETARSHSPAFTSIKQTKFFLQFFCGSYLLALKYTIRI
jgi:hypothetical protein